MLSKSRFTATLLAVTMLTACGALTKPLPAPGPSPLVVASCPSLTPLSDSSFAATTLKLVEVAGLYLECRAAAIGEKTP